MRNVEAVIRLFDLDYCVRAISARRHGSSAVLLFRAALDAMRAAGSKPLTVSEVTAAVLSAKGIRNATDDQRGALRPVFGHARKLCCALGKAAQAVENSAINARFLGFSNR